MKKSIALSTLLSLFVSFTFAQDKLNLDPTTASRFTVADRVWPANVGDADVCLWNDDKLSAFTITIDDNQEGDINFWKSMQSKYGFNFTWFVITEAEDDKYNVKDWTKFVDLQGLGNEVQGHDDRNWALPSITQTVLKNGVWVDPTNPDHSIITIDANQIIKEVETASFNYSVNSTFGGTVSLKYYRDAVSIDKPDFVSSAENGLTGSVTFTPQVGDQGVYLVNVISDNGTDVILKQYRMGINSSESVYLARLQVTQNKIDTEVANGKALTYAYPFGEGEHDEARKQFISIRGTTGLLNHADKVNYLDVRSVSNPHIYADDAKRDTYILPLVTKTSTLWGQNYYRGWGSTHFHHVDAAAQTITDEFLQYLSDKGDDLWVDGFTRVAQYSQSFATHTLTVDAVAQTELKFTVIDEMLNSAFDFPLTVKIRVANNWANISATQNGADVDAELISHEGNTFALVKAVPNGDEVIVTGVEDDDPAIITPIDDQNVEEEKTLEVGFSASNTAGDAITFTVEGNPSFGAFTDNGDNTGKIVFTPQLYDKGVYSITVIADNGTSKSSESFQFTVVDDGSTVTIFADKKDASVYYPLYKNVDSDNRTSGITGGGYLPDHQMSSVFPFELPALSSGLVVVDAKFSVNLEQVKNVDAKLNLFGIDARSSGDVLNTDGFAGAYGSDDNASDIQEDFVNKNTPLGVVNLNAEGSSGLVTYLNNQYINANVGDFVFLRLSTSDVNHAQYDRFLFTTADGAEANATPYPTLIIKFGAPLSNDKTEISNLNVYPNPVNNGIINVSSSNLENNSKVVVNIYNVEGRLVYNNDKTINGNKFQVDISSSLKGGIYYLKVSNENITAVKKILVK